MQLVLHDLEFILAQIKLAERHTAGEDLLTLIGNPLLPYGLRTVDGSYNNVVPGQEEFGAADRPMPNALPQIWRTAESVLFDYDGLGPVQQGDLSSYGQTGGLVFDSQPRTISNLISDQTVRNSAAVAVAGPNPDRSEEGTLFIENVAPDEGLSAPFNSWFTIFGQFFDHGLDLIGKGGRGSVIVSLQPDDPLYIPGSQTNFMVLTRAQFDPDPATGQRMYNNSTTPWIDQNQTYTSHPSHQVFLRDYDFNLAGRPVSTGRLLDGAIEGSIGNWGEVKAQAREMLGINLTDADLGNIPLLLTDEYGNFIPGANGLPQLVLSEGPPMLLREGNLANPVSTAGALRTDHAFLDDIAHNAAPGTFDHDRDPSTLPIAKTADVDAAVSTVPGSQPAGTYDNELLDLHYITGDGRGNENIGLTAVHSVFHSEHNRIVEQVKTLVSGSGNLATLNEWLSTDVTALPTTQAQIDALQWDGARLFQAARFATEMQYQHFVFEEFARKVQPSIDVFSGYNSTVDPAIMSEFANVVYRFGHSMLTDTIDRIDPNSGATDTIGLIEAFLNPAEFAASGATTHDAVGAIVTGLTRQTGNDIDEFLTEALRNNLVGLPLDLGALNIARGRDTGIPGLNAARQLFFDDTGLSILRPYESWADFELGMKNPESLVNFIAAYGTHASLANLTTVAGKRAAAQALLDQAALGDNSNGAVDFLNATGAHEGGSLGGLNNVDFWIGGLAENIQPFGGMLGSTFDYVFSTQLRALQNNDRLYYLARTAGLNVLTQLEEGSMAELVMRNSSARHLPGDIFSTPAYTFELDAQATTGPIVDDGRTAGYDEATLLTRMADGTVRYAGAEHVLFGGTAGNDSMRAGAGDDTLHGDAGNDRMEGGAGNDFFFAGDGNDILTDTFGDDNMKGQGGHDVISNGSGFDLLFGGDGNDFILGGVGDAESFGGHGDDFISAGTGINTVFGDSGNDWIEGGDGADLLQGDNGDPFQQSGIIGHDVLFGDANDDYDAESGDDIMFGTPGINRAEGMLGFDWVTYARSTEVVDADLTRTALLPPDIANVSDRFDLVEGVSGWNGNDTLRGTDLLAADQVGHALDAAGIARIGGLSTVLGTAAGYTGGEILLGGGGSDLLEGRAGDDVIDGDAWLDARIKLTHTNGAVEYVNSMAPLTTRMLNGTINPGQLSIDRVIQLGSGGTDIALFDGPRANFTIGARQADGSRTITDNVGTEGVDRVRNVEVLRFVLTRDAVTGAALTWEDVSLAAVNSAAVGEPTISDGTPTEGGALTASTAGITDANGLGTFSFQWQSTTNGGQTWTNVAGATTASFTPVQAQVGAQLRVQTSFTDGQGTLETQVSAATEVVGDLFNSGAGAQVFTGTAGADIANTGGGNDTLNGNAGNDTLLGGNGDDVLNGGTGADAMTGGNGDDTYVVDAAGDTVTELAGGGADLVRSLLASYTLGANVENLVYAATGAAVVAFSGTGNALANVISGGALGDVLNGAGGADTLNGLDGADQLLGDAGADQLNGGSGNDTLDGGTGADQLSGGIGTDRMTGGAAGDRFIFAAIGEMGTGAARDVIVDFATGADQIDLSAIDANGALAGNLAFTFRGAAGFTAAGQVRYVNAGGNTIVQGNTDANTATAEFEIQLNGTLALNAGQFVL
ncbi:peroxidase family protein [Leptothrix discophora]|uniref:Peroxidase family protein n=1 Tax=Leptothrix discophora TaxID=89 RepID=A0ABT9G439_LEPDI|nr:peroxidase family protein [Leptothrix discophora]MDP4301254.1 peroxidase family protein [Leptothrix discophora]